MKNLIEKIKSLINKHRDKIYHLVVNVLMMLIIGIIFNIVSAIIVSILVSISKELYDEIYEDGSGWDWYDLIADAIGIVIGILILL